MIPKDKKACAYFIVGEEGLKWSTFTAGQGNGIIWKTVAGVLTRFKREAISI
jgi:hypothetical protein